MPVLQVFNQKHEPVSELELDDAIFGVQVKEHLFHLLVRYQLARRRSGSHQTKGRSDVAGGGQKPYRQKGTGRARQGTIRAPQWRGGGVVFGPHNRDHSIKVPKKVRRAALRSALSRRVEDGRLWLVDRIGFDSIKTRHFAEVMAAFGWDKVMVVVPEKDDVLMKSARNIPGVTVMPVAGLNVYDILKHPHLVLTVDAVDAIAKRLGR